MSDATEPAKKYPWFKYFPSDWRADTKLMRCSLAARGLWIELVGHMHECEPYGHLTTPAGDPIPITELARMVAAEFVEVETLLVELGKQHVFSRTPEGIIYCRRMVRTRARSELAKVKGKLGGNPLLMGRDKPTDNQDDAAKLNGRHNPDPSQLKPEHPQDNTYILDAKCYIPDNSARPALVGTNSEPQPKQNKPPNSPPASDAVLTTRAGQKPFAPTPPEWTQLAQDIAKLVETAGKGIYFAPDPHYLDIWREDGISLTVVRGVLMSRYAANPSRPLNFYDKPVREAWVESQKTRAVPTKPPEPERTREQWVYAVKCWKDHGGYPAPGPIPGSFGCLAPEDVQAEFGYVYNGPKPQRKQAHG